MGKLALIAKKFVPAEVNKSQLVSVSFRRKWKPSHALLSPQLPMLVAIDVIQSADRRLFPDAEALAEVIVGELSHVYGIDPAALAAMREFADALLMMLGADALVDGGGQLAKRPNAQIFISAFGVAMREVLE